MEPVLGQRFEGTRGWLVDRGRWPLQDRRKVVDRRRWFDSGRICRLPERVEREHRDDQGSRDDSKRRESTPSGSAARATVNDSVERLDVATLKLELGEPIYRALVGDEIREHPVVRHTDRPQPLKLGEERRQRATERREESRPVVAADTFCQLDPVPRRAFRVSV